MSRLSWPGLNNMEPFSPSLCEGSMLNIVAGVKRNVMRDNSYSYHIQIAVGQMWQVVSRLGESIWCVGSLLN